MPVEGERNVMGQEKIGAGHAQAMFRAGLKELAQALPAFPDGIKPVEEPGLAGNLTPQEVVQSKGPQQSYEQMLEGYAGRGHDPGLEKEHGLELE